MPFELLDSSALRDPLVLAVSTEIAKLLETPPTVTSPLAPLTRALQPNGTVLARVDGGTVSALYSDIVLELMDEMGRKEDGRARVGQLADDVLEKIVARRDVEPGGGVVEDEKRGPRGQRDQIGRAHV